MCFFSKNSRTGTKSANVRLREAIEAQLQGIPHPSSAELEAVLLPLSRQVTAANESRGRNAYSV